MRRIQNASYTVSKKIYSKNILEDEERGPYFKETPIRLFPMSLTGAVSSWLRNEPAGSIDTWETLKKKFLSKYCPPARIVKKMEADKYGYIKNHKKTVKNGQARTRESEEYKKKPKKQSRSQKSQASVKSSQSQSKTVNKSQQSPITLYPDS
ncbi:zinc finger MYM-type protein 1-like protein [Tanacetum coccineum]